MILRLFGCAYKFFQKSCKMFWRAYKTFKMMGSVANFKIKEKLNEFLFFPFFFDRSQLNISILSILVEKLSSLTVRKSLGISLSVSYLSEYIFHLCLSSEGFLPVSTLSSVV